MDAKEDISILFFRIKQLNKKKKKKNEFFSNEQTNKQNNLLQQKHIPCYNKWHDNIHSSNITIQLICKNRFLTIYLFTTSLIIFLILEFGGSN